MERPAGIVGSLGPRLAGRLTAELVLRSPQYMNAVKEYEIDLRGELLWLQRCEHRRRGLTLQHTLQATRSVR